MNEVILLVQERTKIRNKIEQSVSTCYQVGMTPVIRGLKNYLLANFCLDIPPISSKLRNCFNSTIDLPNNSLIL